MPRDFYESVIGRPDPVDAKLIVLGGIRVSVFARDTTDLATIYQRETGVTQGPSPETGATGGPNPFITGSGHDLDLGHPTGSIMFWADAPGRYDILLEDTIVPPRIGSRTIQWNARPAFDIPDTALALSVIQTIVPIGGQIPYAGDGDPPGGKWLLCDGRFVVAATYPTYTTRVGHKYNNGVDPGGGLIKLPDKRGRGSIGADNMGTAQGAAGRLQSLSAAQRASGQGVGSDTHVHTANIPNHTHAAALPNHAHSQTDHTHAAGSLYTGNSANGGITGSSMGASVSVQSLGGGPLVLARGAGAGGEHQHGISTDGNIGVYGSTGGQGGLNTGNPTSLPAITLGAPSATAMTTDQSSNISPSEIDNWIIRVG